VGLTWRSRSRARLLEALQQQVAVARGEMEASLADAVAVVEGRLHKDLEHREQTTTELATRLDIACTTLDAREVDLLHALTRIADTCDTIALRVEADGQERKAMIEVLENLAAALTGNGQAALSQRARDRVMGGTIDSSRSPLDLTEDEAEAPSASPWGSARP
jgi:hypothetical protein